jgi:hypothetical protein
VRIGKTFQQVEHALHGRAFPQLLPKTIKVLLCLTQLAIFPQQVPLGVRFV